MKLISLKTQGFKKLRNHTFDFTDGLNVIVGDNAQGKSTLLQAIECALYGATVVPGKKEHIITWGQKSWKLELHFMLNDLEYMLTRSKSTAKLECSGPDSTKLVANGNTPVTKAIEEVLGLNAKDYNLFMQSKQGETSGVLTFGAAALNRKVEEFSGISTIDDVQQLAQEDYRNAKAVAEANEVEDELLSEAEDSLKTAEADMKLKGVDVEAATQELEAAPRPNDVKRPDSNPETMEKQRHKLSKLRHKLEMVQQDSKNAQNRYQEALQRFEDTEQPDDTADLEESLKTASQEVKAAVKEVNDLSKEFNRQQQLWEDLVKAEQVFDEQRDADEIGEELAALVDRKTAETERYDESKEARIRLDGDIVKLTSLAKEAKCPTCGHQLSEHDPEQIEQELKELTDKRDMWKHEEGAASSQVKEVTAEISKLEKALTKAQETEKQVDTLREQLVEAGVHLESAETPIEAKLEAAKEVHQAALIHKSKLEDKVENSEAEWAAYRRLERNAKQLLAEVEDLADTEASVVSELEGLLEGGEPTEEMIAESRQRWDDYHRLVSEARVEVSEKENQLNVAKYSFKMAQEAVDRCTMNLEKLKETAEKGKESLQLADKAARLSRFLRERRAGYLQEVWDAVLAVASKQVSLATRNMIGRIVFDDGEFFFEEEGILAPIASASGAQKAHIGVAVRIGLSRALYGKDALLIFDEPTESMREHHAIGLSSSLAGAASQCLLITHREQDQDLAANVIEVAA